MKYQIKRAAAAVDISAAWDSACWKDVEALRIVNARSEGSNHQPKAELKLQYDDQGIYGLFNVDDYYVRSVSTGFQGQVCRDSCTEFFFELPGFGYFNLEMNCGSGMLLYYIRDNARKPEGGFADMDILPDEDISMVKKFHTRPDVVEPEVVGDTNYRVGFFFPYALIKKYADIQLPKAGTLWRMNAYKCGDATSHPHWLAWNPVKELNFHRPEDFGVLEFC
ncbi:MAG: carbohydrate-binding family 9-like protein [Lentisphaeria bacterium]|nr:carbohydrate-binding family 9-like protein [Lentisphaeria bacterium]